MKPDLTNYQNKSRSESEQGSRVVSWIVLGLALSGFLALAWYAYQSSGESMMYQKIPTIEADTSPIKVKPNMAGGEEFPHQDKTIYNVISSQPDPQRVEKLIAEPEEPILPTMQEVVSSARESQAASTWVNERLRSAEALEEPLSVIEDAPEQEPVLEGETVARQEIKPEPVTNAVVDNTPVVSEKPAVSASHKIQLGAFGSNLDAEKNWKRIQDKHPLVLGGMPHVIARAELPKGTFYRLRVAGFASKELADMACKKLKKQAKVVTTQADNMTHPKSFICGVVGDTLSLEEAAFIKEHQPYGVILFARNCIAPNQVRQLVCDIKNELTHPYASILIDQEGGRVARLKPPHWRAYPSAATLAAHKNSAEIIALNARLIADDLRALGITTNCAPLADVPAPDGHDIIGDRAFGNTPETVIVGARAQTSGLREGGIMPVLKHIPGHGRATADSHLALPEVHASRETLEATDFAPFRALSDMPLAMTAHIRYHALDSQHVSTFSSKVIELIREHIGFHGLLMSDDLSMKALSGCFAERTRRSLQSGCDLALHCNGHMEEMQAVAGAAPVMHNASIARAEQALSWLPEEISDLPVDAVAQWQAACAA